MVREIEYENYQLDLILTEYLVQGYRIAEREKKVKDFRFDAIVANHDNTHYVIIEAINRRRADVYSRGREKKFSEMLDEKTIRDALGAAPTATISVDFRYIDSETIRNDRNIIIQKDNGLRTLNGLLKDKLPPSAPDIVKNRERQFLSDWSLIARTIRAAIAHWFSHEKLVSGNSVLECYNLLLAHSTLVPAEQLAMDYFKSEDNFFYIDLFDLHEKVLSVIEGATVTSQEVKALRFHLVMLRKQIKEM